MKELTGKELLTIRDFDSLLDFLVDELEWPIDIDNLGPKDLTFEYSAEEIGLKESEVAKVNTIKQLRPIVSDQPWAIFWMDFDNKKLPVTVLRRILRHFVVKKRAADPNRATWQMEDIMFISGHGDDETRGVTFAHFKTLDGKEVMREFSWDKRETNFDHYADYLNNLKWPEDESDIDAWKAQWRSAFTGSTREAVSTSLQLAKAMAWLARDIKARVLEVYEIEHEKGSLHKLYDSFRSGLLSTMTVHEFADMYAQTITYGLFSARTMDVDGHFEMEEVVDLIPNTNPFLKTLFKECLEVGANSKGIDLDELGVGRLVDLLDGLNRSDGTDAMKRILKEFGRQSGGGSEDPVIHFYEDFLKEYDQIQRVERGVYYTPDPVVSFIVRSVHEQLKTEFGLEMGLADTTTWEDMVASGRAEYPKDPQTGKVNKDIREKLSKRAFVQILDPATGTGTFLKHTITVIHDEVKAKHKREGISQDWLDYWNDYVYHNLLPRLFAFELMMASYSVAHMKVGMHLKALGYRFEKPRRLHIYLTNSLEPATANTELRLFYSSVGEEAMAANRVKKDRFFSVVIGNPPYSGISSNKGQWISDLNEDYKYVDGEHFGERKHWLGDDYVKFIRFAHHMIDINGEGVIGYINNHSFLDNPTFRGMRWQLLSSFDSIKIIDLHGNSLKKEVAPDSSKDENVFDIQAGVSINLFIKIGKKKKGELAQVFHQDFWGKRSDKYDKLLTNDLKSLQLKEIEFAKPYYFFVPTDTKLEDEYSQFIAVTSLFPTSTVGFVSANDTLNISFTKAEHDIKLRDLETLDESSWRNKYSRLKDSRDWTYLTAMSDYLSNKSGSNHITVEYRPFDYRSTFYTGTSRGLYSSPQRTIMQHLVKHANVGLVVPKINKEDNCTFISKRIISHKVCSAYDSNSLFPLYLYLDKHQLSTDSTGIRPNIDENLAQQLAVAIGCDYVFDEARAWEHGNQGEVLPLDILDYTYAVLHSPAYREKYKEFLKIDFPRVPYPKNDDQFGALVKLGAQLREIHLLERDVVNRFITTYEGFGSDEITKSMTAKSPGWVAYEDDDTIGDVWINDTQYFGCVPKLAWEFYIGGYQPAQKWLKDRKGRQLSKEDIEHYQKIIVALTETDRLMQEIDNVGVV